MRRDSHAMPSVPPLSLVLGYGPMFVILLAGIVSWFVSGGWLVALTAVTIVWSSALLLFLAGVRRGLSFFTRGGPQPAQIATMFWLFIVGLVALVLPYPRVQLFLALIGFVSLMILDPVAARHGQAPDFFRTLRPPQMVVPVIGLALLLLRVWVATVPASGPA